jgi:uncharacterized membrane protein
MQPFLNALQALDLHPIVDHFTVALLITGVFIDLIASLVPARAWIRYMALTLMVLGAIAAGCSYATGGLEADRVFKALNPEARSALHWHAEFGEATAIVFGVLALWRILVESVGYFGNSRPIYLLAAVIASGVLGYTGHLGGRLVYYYGVGVRHEAVAAVASPTATPARAPIQTLPTVSVPTPTPAAKPPAAAPTHAGPSPGAARSATPSPRPTPEPRASASV